MRLSRMRQRALCPSISDTEEEKTIKKHVFRTRIEGHTNKKP